MKSLIFQSIIIIVGICTMLSGTASGQITKPSKPRVRISVNVNGKEVKEQSVAFHFPGGTDTSQIIPVTMYAPGLLTVKLEWVGNARILQVILSKPGLRPYKLGEGSSPLYLNFDLSRQLITQGDSWDLVIVNSRRGTSALGVASIFLPLPEVSRAPRVDTIKMNYSDFLALDRCTWGQSKKQFLPDGNFRIDYSNGFYIIKKTRGILFYNSEEQKLYEVIFPSGTSPFYSTVQKAAPPYNPNLTNNEESKQWLNHLHVWIMLLNNQLLNEITRLLDNDSDMLQSYQKLEEGKSQFQILEFRLKSLRELREICGE